MIRVIIVDDHQLVAEGVAKIIGACQKIEVIAIANSISMAISLLGIHKPDILLVDVAMPDGDGIDAIKMFTDVHPSMRIIVVTSYAEPAVIQRAMDNGADGYILKNAEADELTDGIMVVAKGDIYICKEAQELMIGHGDAPPELTKRELEILRLIVAGLTQKEIADRLCLGFETIHSYTKYIRQKLGCSNSAAMVRTAIERHLI